MRRFRNAFIISLALLVLVASPCLAYVYFASYSISETDGTAHAMLALSETSNNDWAAANGFLLASALDTRVETLGGLEKPWMVAEDRTLTATAVPANSQVNLYYTMGGTLAAAMDIITGYDGYVTVADAAALEPGDDFSIKWSGYFDPTITDYFIEKADALMVGGDGTGDITAHGPITTPAWVDPTGFVDPSVDWTDEAKAYDNNLGTFALSAAVPTTTWTGYLELTHASFSTAQIRIYFHGTGVVHDCDIDVYDGSWNDVFQGAFVDGWQTLDASYSGVTKMRVRGYNGDGVNRDFRVYDSDFGEVFAPSVTATVAAGTHVYDAFAEGNAPIWATGDVLHFDGSNASEIDCGLIHNGVAKGWVSLWFKLDADFDPGDGFKDIWCKKGGGFVNYLELRFQNSGAINFLKSTGGVTDFNINTVATHWDADTWYHVIASTDSVNGVRLIVDGGAPVTNADVSAWPGVGNFIIGDEVSGGGAGLTGEIMNVVLGTDTLGGAEETALYAGVAPGDENNYWHIDEGTGTDIVDAGSDGNDGTAGGNNSWETATYAGAVKTGRWADFVLMVDDPTQRIGTNLKGASVPDNANDWILFDGNISPWVDYFEYYISSVLTVDYEPVTMIIGTALPDKAGAAQDGVITWGANPTGVNVTLGGLASTAQPPAVSTADRTTADILPEAPASDWYEPPDVAGTLLTHPLRPFVTIMSGTTSMPESQAWIFLGLVFVVFIFGVSNRAVRGHHLITGIATGVAIGLCVQQTIFPGVALLFAIGAIAAGVVAERSRTL